MDGSSLALYPAGGRGFSRQRLFHWMKGTAGRRFGLSFVLLLALLPTSALGQFYAGFESVSLSWNASTAPGHTGYNVYRRIRRFSSQDPRSIVIDGSFSDWNRIEPATQYPYPPEDELFIKDLWVANDDRYLYLRLRAGSRLTGDPRLDPTSPVDIPVVYLDVDSNAATGTRPWARGLKIGAEYRLRILPSSAQCAAYLDPFNPDFDPHTMTNEAIWLGANTPVPDSACAIGDDGAGAPNNGIEVRIPLAQLGGVPSSGLVGMDMYFQLDIDFFPLIGYGNKTPLKFEYGYHRIAQNVTAPNYMDSVSGGLNYEYVVTDVTQGGVEKLVYSGLPIRVPRAHPSAFNVSVVSPTSLSMTWVSPEDPGAAGVRIVRSTTHYPANEQDGTVVYEGQGNGFTDTGLTPITSYYYSAFGYDGRGHYSHENWEAQDRSMPSSVRGPMPVTSKDDYMIYFGSWDDGLVNQAKKYKVVMLHPGGGAPLITPDQIREIQSGVDNIPGTDDDVIVIAYVSIGEDYGDFNPATPGFNQPRQHLSSEFNDGSGPCYFDWVTGQVVYENKGFPSFYVDEFDLTIGMNGHDYYPDQNLDWGGLYVNSGDAKWQAFLKQATYEKDGVAGFDYVFNTLGVDGVFLDTVGVSAPWTYWNTLFGDYYWIKDGHLDFLAKLGYWYPDKFIIPNRPMHFMEPELAGKRYDDFRAYANAIFWESYTADVKYWRRDRNADLFEQAVHTAADNSDGRGFTPFVLDYYKVMIEGQEGGEQQHTPWYHMVPEQVQHAQNLGFHSYVAPSRSLAETSDDVYRINRPEVLGGKPDLAVHSVFGTDTGSGVVDLTITVINQSQTSITTPFVVQAVHNATPLAPETVTNPLGPWQQYSYHRTIQMQDIGNNIHVTADPDGAVDDFDRSNNDHDTYLDSIVYPAPAGATFVPKILPDSIISAINVIPGTPVAGQPVTLRITYANIGLGVMKASRTFVWLGTAGSGRQVGNLPTSFLMPGQSGTVDLQWTPPTRGTYFVSAVANAVATIVESNEQNNTLVSSFTVVSPPQPVTDWSNDPNVITVPDTTGDGPGGRAAGDITEVWISQSDTSMLFRMQTAAPAEPDLNYLLFIDTDTNASTGYQTGDIGAEFMVYNGDLYSYGGDGTSWTWQQVAGDDQVTFAFEQDSRFIDIAVPKSLLGVSGTSHEAFRFAVSDASGDSPDYSPNDSSIGYPPVSGVIRIDGRFGDWNAVPVLLQDGKHTAYNAQGKEVKSPLNPAADLQTVWAIHDQNYLFFRLSMQGSIDFSKANVFIFLDTDGSPKTGYSTSLGSMGADYVFWNGKLYQHAGGRADWNWQLLDGAAAFSLGGDSPNQVEIALQRSAFGWLTDVPIKLMFMTQADGLNHFAPDLGKAPASYPVIKR